MELETLIIKGKKHHEQDINPLSSPLYLSTTFLRNDDGSFANGYRYSRLDSPNRRELENLLAHLEGGKTAFAFSSGMAAVQAVFQSLKSGDHILLPDDVFFNVKMLAKDIFEQWGLDCSGVDMSNIKAIASSIRPNTRLIWIETPSNPQLKISNIEKIVGLTEDRNIIVAVDNTWPTPVLQKPLDLGADIVMHSTTKYFGGHSDVMGGCLILREEGELGEKLLSIQVLSGAVPSPFDCWLVSRGIKTLPLRVKSQSYTAHQLANYLENHPKIAFVYYPGLENHPQYAVATTQMKNGYGAMLSVLIKGDKENAISVSNRLKLFTRATSLGGVESLVEHRESVEGRDSPTPDNLLRISVGLEHIDDLIDDWKQALNN